jgi:hypothetical protein
MQSDSGTKMSGTSRGSRDSLDVEQRTDGRHRAREFAAYSAGHRLAVEGE